MINSNRYDSSLAQDHAIKLKVENSRTIALDNLTAYSLVEIEERDTGGLIASAGVLLNLAAVFLVGVMAFGWRENFLIAVVLLMAFGIASLLELKTASKTCYQRFTFYQPGAQPATLTCADPKRMATIIALLSDHGVKQV